MKKDVEIPLLTIGNWWGWKNPGSAKYTVEGNKLKFTIEYSFYNTIFSKECELTDEELKRIHLLVDELNNNKDELKEKNQMITDGGFFTYIAGENEEVRFENNEEVDKKVQELIDDILKSKNVDIKAEAYKEVDEWIKAKDPNNYVPEEEEDDFSLTVSSSSGLGMMPHSRIFQISNGKLTYTIDYPFQRKTFSSECELTDEDMNMIYSFLNVALQNYDKIKESDRKIMDASFNNIKATGNGESLELNNNTIAGPKIREIIDFIVSMKEKNIIEEVENEVQKWHQSQGFVDDQKVIK